MAFEINSRRNGDYNAIRQALPHILRYRRGSTYQSSFMFRSGYFFDPHIETLYSLGRLSRARVEVWGPSNFQGGTFRVSDDLLREVKRERC